MNYEELAFVNQQLAAMLKDGIPLEGALRQLCETMARGDLKTEFQRLEADLAQGVPLKDALAPLKLPEFYSHMINVGIASNNLPGVLTMLADYYSMVNSVWTRLKGLMVYPLIVSLGALALSFILAWVFRGWTGEVRKGFDELLEGAPLPAFTQVMFDLVPVGLWSPVIALGLVAVMVVAVVAIPNAGQRFRWRLPVFRETNLWQFASGVALMLKSGCQFDEALALMQHTEGDSRAAAELASWRNRLASGHTRFQDIAGGSRVFPPFFVWTISSAHGDLVAGFERAARLYQQRAHYGIDTFLYGVLPMSVVVLGSLIFIQVFTLVNMVIGQFLPLVTITGKL